MRLASFIAAIALVSFGANARSPVQQARPASKAKPTAHVKPPKHAHHAKLLDWHKFIKPGALAKLKTVGADLVKNAEAKASTKAHDFAMAKVKQLFPKADPETIDRAIAVALHHGSEMLHQKMDTFAKQAASKAGQAASAKFHEFVAHHEHFEKSISGIMGKVGGAAKGLRLGKLF